MKYFFDTYALVEIVEKNPNYVKFIKEEIVTGILNIGEFYYSLLKDYDESTAQNWLKIFGQTIIPLSTDTAINAMKFKFLNRKKNFSFVDCCSYMQAKENNLIFLTGDKEFKGMPNVEFVK
ncbi:MAG: PIN domain-containing protein [Candidatus Diapherotrites archaeon]